MSEEQQEALNNLEELSKEELIKIIHFAVELVNQLRGTTQHDQYWGGN